MIKGTFVSLALLTVTACDLVLPDAPNPESLLEGPVEGLSGQQLAAFLSGDGEFSRRFGPVDGLGPIFVATSCESCHVGDGKGHPLFNLRRFGRMRTDGSFDPMRNAGGPQLQNRAILNVHLRSRAGRRDRGIAVHGTRRHRARFSGGGRRRDPAGAGRSRRRRRRRDLRPGAAHRCVGVHRRAGSAGIDLRPGRAGAAYPDRGPFHRPVRQKGLGDQPAPSGGDRVPGGHGTHLGSDSRGSGESPGRQLCR